jgi:iron complex outermembrane receptor protein
MGVSAWALMLASLPEHVSAAPAVVAGDSEDTIIVTGTRDVGVKAQDSATPIEVLGAEALEATGATTAFDALKDILPSFSANGWSADASELVRAARLRGMNPGEVLILVNGKRRHQAASITPGGSDQSPDSGSNPSDLDMIPVSAIDHVEVLLDGAAAQYGSDAVAGVINIILKNNAEGTNIYAGGGITSRGDGAQGSGGFNQGLALGADGFLSVSGDYRHQDFSNRNTFNCRTFATGCIGGGETGSETNINGVQNGPVKNRIEGSPLSDLVNLGFNAEKPVNSDLTLYAFGTFGRRSAQAYENDREDARAPFYWPDGFFPRETLNEVDAAITAGVKGSNFGWNWDLSATYGRDSDHFGLINSYNTGLSNPPDYAPHPGLGLDTGFTGGSLFSAEYQQTTVNADIRREFELGHVGTLNVAFGGEYRYETYDLGAGDPGTYIDGGTQSEAGLTPTDASSHFRHVEAGYADVSTRLFSQLTVDLAGRYETYSQTGVGDTLNGKGTVRYDFSPQLGIRGTVSNGFHAPSLAQSYYSATGVTPSSLSIQAPPTSPGAQLLGAQPLKPETSKDVSFGVVTEPLDKLHISADVYQIFLDKAIIDSAQVTGPTALLAAAANGNPIPAALLASTSAYVSFFANSVDTRTRGLDVNGDYRSDFGNFGTVKWSTAANWNSIAITNQYALPPQMQAALIAGGQAPTYVNPQIRTDLTKSSPQNKITAAANWKWHDLEVTLRETRYGHADQNIGTSSAVTPNGNIFIKSAYITDIDIGYFVTEGIRLNIGGNNVFDHLPGQLPVALRTGRESDLYPFYTPWGINGAYFYTKISASF